VVDTGKNIEKRLKKLMPSLPIGIEITKIAWQSDLVNASIKPRFPFLKSINIL
jgi:multidrug efflux pump subunit AcrB